MSWFPTFVLPALPLFWSQTTVRPRRQADWSTTPKPVARRPGRGIGPRRLQPFAFVCDSEGEEAIRKLIQSGRISVEPDSDDRQPSGGTIVSEPQFSKPQPSPDGWWQTGKALAQITDGGVSDGRHQIAGSPRAWKYQSELDSDVAYLRRLLAREADKGTGSVLHAAQLLVVALMRDAAFLAESDERHAGLLSIAESRLSEAGLQTVVGDDTPAPTAPQDTEAP